MKIVITGGTGLIGTALVQKLIQQKHQIVVLSRKPESACHLPEGSRVAYWDAQHQGNWASELNNSDVVINLAGASIAGENLLSMRWTEKRKANILNSRLNAGRALTEAIQQNQRKPTLFMQASAIGYYGPQDNQPLTESSPVGQDFMASVCDQWEKSTQEIENWSRRVILRTGLVFSNAGGIYPTLALPFKLMIGGPVGRGKQILSWIHMEDYLQALLFLIQHPEAKGIYNLTAPQAVSSREFAHTYGQVYQKPSRLPAPALLLKLALGESATLALDGQRVLPQRLQAEGFIFKFNQLQPALEALRNE